MDQVDQGMRENKGYVYILVNPAFTGFVKIGKTTKDPETRARQLSAGSGVPAPYAVAWDALVSDCDHVERLIHQQLAESRSRSDREFFATPLKNAIAVASTIVASFSCETQSLDSNVQVKTLGSLEQGEVRSGRRIRQKGLEELILVAEDCQVERAEAPPDGNPKTIARIGYEILFENPYRYTEREFYHELHAVRRNRPDLNFHSYNIKRAPVVKVHGWGIHRNSSGKLALVAKESARYRELRDTIKTSKAFRSNKATSNPDACSNTKRKTVQDHLRVCAPVIQEAFQKFRVMVKELHPDVRENSWSYGIAYRAQQNFAEVYFRRNRLEICLRPKEYHDPKRLLSEIPQNYKWTLNRRFILETQDQLLDLIPLVRQSWQDVN